MNPLKDVIANIYSWWTLVIMMQKNKIQSMELKGLLGHQFILKVQ